MYPRVGVANDPAAGSEFTWNGPTSTIIRLRAIRAQFVTSGTAGNRLAVLRIRDANGDVLAQICQAGVQGPGITTGYTWGVGLPASAPGGQGVTTGLPDMWLPPGVVIDSQTTTRQVGDQWSGIVVSYVIPDDELGASY